MDTKVLKNDRLFRALSFKRESVNTEARTVEIAFSSELPYERYFGIEILDHGQKSIRLGRLMDGAPLLLNHDPDEQIGVVESVEIGADRIGRAVVRFGKGEDATEVFNDVVDGIRRKISVGYMIHEMVLDGKKDGTDVYRVTDWEPFEISIVSIPADNSVGVGRGIEQPISDKGTEKMTTETTTPVASAPAVDVRAIEADARATARKDEMKRIADLETVGGKFAQFGGVELARDYIASGKSVGELETVILERAGKLKPMPTAEIGMTDKEIKQFSFVKLLNAVSSPSDRAAQNAAGFELELSSAARSQTGKEARGGATIPVDVLKRDLTAGTAADGGNTVQTDLLEGSFIDMLRNRLAIQQVGATMLTGLNGNVAIPRQSGAASSFWVAENAAPTESQQTLAQVTLTPKTVGAFTDYSRRLMLQSSMDVEAFVRNDLAAVLALAIDLAAINGSGASNQPRGIINTAGIGSVAGGTNGAQVTWANLVQLETAVATANADVGNMGYLTNAAQRGRMKSITKTSPSTEFLWTNGDTPVNGYRCGISNQVPGNLVKGASGAVCSAILFGNWADLLIGMWGGLDIMADPYTGSTAGTVRIVALQDVDVAVRNAVSFSAMLDAL
jgi:HK97 family phage major capsid protein